MTHASNSCRFLSSAVIQADSDEPLTSGDEEDEEDEADEALDARQLFQLLSLEESQQRLREARPPEAPAVYQKRWGRVQMPSRFSQDGATPGSTRTQDG